jgi:hypothetical protein
VGACSDKFSVLEVARPEGVSRRDGSESRGAGTLFGTRLEPCGGDGEHRLAIRDYLRHSSLHAQTNPCKRLRRSGRCPGPSEFVKANRGALRWLECDFENMSLSVQRLYYSLPRIASLPSRFPTLPLPYPPVGGEERSPAPQPDRPGHLWPDHIKNGQTVS